MKGKIHSSLSHQPMKARKVNETVALNEIFVGYHRDRKGDIVEIYENPKSIKKFGKDTRGVIGYDGNLYMIDDSYNMLHDDLKKFLNSKGKKVDPIDSIRQPHVTRYEDTNYIYMSEAYVIDAVLKRMEETVRKCSMLNPNLVFVMKPRDKANLKSDLENPNIIKIKDGKVF